VCRIGRWGITAFNGFSGFLVHLSHFSSLLLKVVRSLVHISKNPDLTIHQMYVLGIQTFSLAIAVSAFIGAEVVLNAVYQFAGIIPYRYLGLAVRSTILTEFAPVIIAIVFSGRIATSIAAEIGNMKRTEQLDSMVCLQLDPIRYLLMPRVAACMFMLPIIVIFSALFSLLFSIVTVLLFVDTSLHEYLMSLRMWFHISELVKGVVKTAPFGFAIGMAGVYFGMISKNSVEGIGEATSKAVMVSSSLVLIMDFFLAFMLK
jgi:phospholipid/cholesterol/gamma-HCH transport system permease protein